MPTVRIIACLDVARGNVVKGENFGNLREMGNPVDLALLHSEGGADEITLLDIEATIQKRGAILELVSSCAEQLMIPLTVGGGVDSVDSVGSLLQAGADKVSIGSAAVSDPGLLKRIATEYGSQLTVASLDICRGSTKSGFELTTHGGRNRTDLDAITWIGRLEQFGVGEVLLNSIDADGTRRGFDLALVAAARAATPLPLVASGGAGKPEHFVAATRAGADALLAASIFHSGLVSIAEVKSSLAQAGFEVRRVDRQTA
jgi:cyclase